MLYHIVMLTRRAIFVPASNRCHCALLCPCLLRLFVKSLPTFAQQRIRNRLAVARPSAVETAFAAAQQPAVVLPTANGRPASRTFRSAATGQHWKFAAPSHDGFEQQQRQANRPYPWCSAVACVSATRLWVRERYCYQNDTAVRRSTLILSCVP